MKKFILFTVFGALLSCSPVKVFMDFDREVAFNNYSSYAFFKPGIEDVDISDLDKRRILKSIEKEMSMKSLTLSQQPDLLVNIAVDSKDRVVIDNGNYGYGFWGWNPWFFQPRFNSISTYTQGELYIDLIDAKTKRLVWQGKGKGNISETTKNRDERIGVFVAEILKNYPPEVGE